MYKILVYGRGFSPDPHRPFGDFENSKGRTVARAEAWMHGVPSSGIFKIPSGLRGSGWKSPPKNQNFLYKFLLKFQLKLCEIYNKISWNFTWSFKFRIIQLKLSDEISWVLYRKFWFLGGDFENPQGQHAVPESRSGGRMRRETPNGGRSGGSRAQPSHQVD